MASVVDARVDCGGQRFADIAMRYHRAGAVTIVPCFKPALLDAAEWFTTAVAGEERAYAGGGCPGTSQRGGTCQYEKLGLTHRTPIQDGLLNRWHSDGATHDISADIWVRELIRYLHDGKMPTPFQTKNFYLGSMTPLHADLIFHDSWPTRNLLVATWLALEDVSPLAGPMVYVDGSHLDGMWDFAFLNLTRSHGNDTRCVSHVPPLAVCWCDTGVITEMMT